RRAVRQRLAGVGTERLPSGAVARARMTRVRGRAALAARASDARALIANVVGCARHAVGSGKARVGADRLPRCALDDPLMADVDTFPSTSASSPRRIAI